MKAQCLICEKDLPIQWEGTNHEQIADGGYMYVEFHYGSRHDQCKGGGEYIQSGDDLLCCAVIETYICDDCFDKKRHLMKGINPVGKTPPKSFAQIKKEFYAKNKEKKVEDGKDQEGEGSG